MRVSGAVARSCNKSFVYLSVAVSLRQIQVSLTKAKYWNFIDRNLKLPSVINKTAASKGAVVHIKS